MPDRRTLVRALRFGVSGVLATVAHGAGSHADRRLLATACARQRCGLQRCCRMFVSAQHRMELLGAPSARQSAALCRRLLAGACVDAANLLCGAEAWAELLGWPGRNRLGGASRHLPAASPLDISLVHCVRESAPERRCIQIVVSLCGDAYSPEALSIEVPSNGAVDRARGTRAEPPSLQSSVWLHRAIQSIDSTARVHAVPHIAESPARVREWTTVPASNAG